MVDHPIPNEIAWGVPDDQMPDPSAAAEPDNDFCTIRETHCPCWYRGLGCVWDECIFENE